MIRLFAHRGFVTGNISQNSIASLKQAHDSAFFGVEFDIWFLNQELLLKHDKPTGAELQTLPRFSDYLVFKNDIFYWCDFKNLDERNCAAAMQMVKEKLSQVGVSLDQVYFAPFITDYELAAKILQRTREVFGDDAQVVAVCEKLDDPENVAELREFLTQNKIKFLSIFHKLIDKNFVRTFHDITLFAWTVNDLKRIHELEQLNVKNFATDKITPKDYEGNSNPAIA